MRSNLAEKCCWGLQDPTEGDPRHTDNSKNNRAENRGAHERLTVLLRANPATHARGRGVYRVIFQAMMEAEHDTEIARAIRRHLNKLHGFLAAELVELQETGAVREDESPAGLAWALMCLAIGYGMIVPIGVRGQTEALSKGAMQALLGDLIGSD